MKKYMAAVISILVLSGCATVTSSQKMGGSHIYPLPKEAVYDASVRSIMANQWQLNGSDKAGGVITALTPMSMMTAGDLLTIYITATGENSTQVDVTSTAKQAYDWGKGEQNIKRFYSTLSAQLPQ